MSVKEGDAALNAKFFEELLRRDLADATIRDVRIVRKVPAVGKGANFLSNLWRFAIVYRCENGTNVSANGNAKATTNVRTSIEIEIPLIVKCEPASIGACTKLIKAQDLFGTEIHIFADVLPRMKELLGGRSLTPKWFNFTPIAEDDRRFIVLEDLKARGFRTKDRQIGLPLANSIASLQILADFHATSVYLYEQNPNLLESLNEGLISEKTPVTMCLVIMNTLRMVIDACRDNWGSIYRKIGDKLMALEAIIIEELVHCTRHEKNEFCVLNHGDYWTNNIMFREDERGNPLEVMLIDFQMSVYSSPAIDLLYFFGICPTIDIKTEKREFLISLYHDRLVERMASLGCATQPPTIRKIHEAMLKRRSWAIMAGLALHPRIIADLSEIETFDDILDTGVTRMNIFKNPNAAVALQKLLVYMNETGYFD